MGQIPHPPDDQYIWHTYVGGTCTLGRTIRHLFEPKGTTDEIGWNWV